MPRKASTPAAVFDTKYSSPAVAPAKKVQFSQRNLLDAVYRMAKMYRGTKKISAKDMYGRVPLR